VRERGGRGAKQHSVPHAARRGYAVARSPLKRRLRGKVALSGAQELTAHSARSPQRHLLKIASRSGGHSLIPLARAAMHMKIQGIVQMREPITINPPTNHQKMKL
jgi:hypothetical protein